MVSKTTKLTRMGRRRFLNTLAGMGISLEAVRHMSKDRLESLTGDPEDEVPRLKGLRPTDPEAYVEPPYPDTRPEREPEYYTIPRDEWIANEATLDAARRIAERVDELDDSGLVSVWATTTVRGQQRVRAVEVERREIARPSASRRERIRDGGVSVDDLDEDEIVEPDVTLDELRGELPDEQAGTVRSDTEGTAIAQEQRPIEFTESIEIEDGCRNNDCGRKSFWRNYYDHEYRENGIPMGCHIDTEGTGGPLTLGPRMWSDDRHEFRFVTNAHGFIDQDDEEGSDEGRWKDVMQPDSGRWNDYDIGSARELDYYSNDSGVREPLDVAVISFSQDLDEGIYAAPYLASDSGDDEYRNCGEGLGKIGADNLCDSACSDGYDSLYMQGMGTGRCERDIDAIESVNEDEFGVELTEIRLEVEDDESWGGNSGGPYFREDLDDDNGPLIAGIHRASNTDKDRRYGITIDLIEEHYDLRVL